MNITGNQVARVAEKLGYTIKEGRKHLIIYHGKHLVTTVPRGKVKDGTLHAIIKRLGLTRDDFNKLL